MPSKNDIPRSPKPKKRSSDFVDFLSGMLLPKPKQGASLEKAAATGLNRRYFRPQDLRRLSHLFFSPRRIVEGQYSGHHATRQRGQSVEFRDYRQYIPGDEISAIDWKVYGRSDKLFIKLYEHQADLTVHLLVDASASMGYYGLKKRFTPNIRRRTGATNQPLSKYDYACSMAAAIAFLIIKQHDRVSYSYAQRGLAAFLAPGGSMPHFVGVLDKMESTLPRGPAKLADAIRRLNGNARRRDLLIVISDLLEDREDILESLSMCMHRGGEVIVFHVLHADELKLPHIENGLFIDSETKAKMRLNIEDIRPAYEEKIREFLDGWSKSTRSNGMDYLLCSTADPYHVALQRYLGGRAARV